jgi:hypothetical protein
VSGQDDERKDSPTTVHSDDWRAEGVGFEPTRDFHPCRFSSSRESCPPVSRLSNPVH